MVGNREGKRPLERPSRGRNDGIKMDLEEIGWGVNWIGLICLWIGEKWRAFVNEVKNIRVL